MADLRLGSSVGGQLIWTVGNLPLKVNDTKVSFKGHDFVTTEGGQTINGDFTFTGTALANYIKSSGDYSAWGTTGKSAFESVNANNANPHWVLTSTDGTSIRTGIQVQSSSGGALRIYTNSLAQSYHFADGNISVSATLPAASNHLTRKSYVDDQIQQTLDYIDSGSGTLGKRVDDLEAADLTFVNMTGVQTISGVKTFTALPVAVSVPTANGHLVNKAYADTKVSAVTGTGAISVTAGTTPVVSIAAATQTAPGTMSATDKTKLDGIPADAVSASKASFTGPVTIGTQDLKGSFGAVILKDLGNGNVVLSASKNSSLAAGSLYLGYNSGTTSVTDKVRLETQMDWKAAHNLVDSNGLLNSDKMYGTYTSTDTRANVSKPLYVTGDIYTNGNAVFHSGNLTQEASGGLLMRVGGPRDNQIAQALANTTGGAYVSPDSPPDPYQGMRWYCTLDGRTYIYYIHEITYVGQWVEESPQSPDWVSYSRVIAGLDELTDIHAGEIPYATGTNKFSVIASKAAGRQLLTYDGFTGHTDGVLLNAQLGFKTLNYNDRTGFRDLSYSGFYRPNNNTLNNLALPNLMIHVAHPTVASAGHQARGIGFQYGGSGWGISTTRFDASGNYLGQAKIYTEQDKPKISDLDNVESGTGNLMRVNGPRDQQIANALANTTGGAYVSETPPDGPFQGMRWFNTKNGRTFIYYIDGVGGQWVEENPQSPDWITTSPVLSGIAHETTMLSHRNLLINGDFRIWQRYTNKAVVCRANGYDFIADRWFVYSGDSTVVANLEGSWWGPDSRDVLMLGGTTASNTGVVLHQSIESQNTGMLIGKKVTFSYWIWSTDARSVDSEFWYANTKDKFWDGLTVIERIKTDVKSNGWQKVSVTTTLPAESVNGIQVRINAGPLRSGIVVFNCVQLELGEVATPFEHRPYSYELDLCQRYYRGALTFHSTNTDGAWTTFNVPTQNMRTVPTIVGGIRVYNGASGAIMGDPVTTDTFYADGNGYIRIGSMPNKPGIGGWVGIHFRGFDAEL